MIFAPKSASEDVRRAASRGGDGVDPCGGETFDDFAALAAQICGTPIGFISVVDGGRHRVEASVGWAFKSSMHDAALCDHAMLSAEGLLAVEDLGLDTRFAHDSLVVGPPHLASFVAVRVSSPDGLPLGTICAADRRPRAYSAANLRGLQRLARQLESQLSLRRAVEELHDDVAHLAEAQSRLSKSEELYRQLVESAQGLICIHDLDGRLQLINQGGARLLGAPVEALVGRRLHDFVPPEHHEAFDAYLRRMRAEVRSTGLVTMRAADGRKCALAYHNYRFDSGGGSCILGHGLDITELVKAEQANRRFAAALEASTDAVVLADVRGRLFHMNRSARDACGLPPGADVRLLRLPDLLPQGAMHAGIAGALQHGTWSGEMTWQGLDGRETPFSVVMLAPREPDRDPDFVAVVARDISAQRTLSGDLLRAHEAAMAASRLQSEFIANVSHEIRTPINGVLGLTCALLDTNLTDLQREYGEGVKQSAEALLDIVNDILDLSKIEAGKLAIERLPFDIRRTLMKVAEPVASRARRKGLAVSVTVSDDVPARAMGDPVRFGQIVLNFLDNAVKFTSHGRIATDVRVVPSWNGPRLRVAVTDTGIGLAADKHAAVFEKFMQADSSTTRQYGGSGLGLAICRQLVGLMDGEIGVESEPGKGATFWFTLPLSGTSDQLSDEHAAAPLEVPKRDGAALRALVAEDNAVNRMVARLFLEKAGLSVDQVENGRQALDRLETERYDVVFLDCQMPELDGYETALRLRSIPGLERLPVVALTASAMSGDREKCLEAGMTDYLSKPLQAAALNAVLERLVGTVVPPSVPESSGRPGFMPAEVLAACGEDRSTVSELVALLERDLPIYLRDLQQGLASSSWEVARASAHRIRGAVGNVAAADVERLAGEIEQALQNREVGRAIVVAPLLEAAMATLVSNLRRWVDRLPEKLP